MEIKLKHGALPTGDMPIQAYVTFSTEKTGERWLPELPWN
jgi:hypothetical protein